MKQNSSIVFLIFFLLFVLIWLAVTKLLDKMSGWSRLMADFPDRDEAPISQFNWKSGNMNLVGMRNILKLGVCPSGLRIGVFRLFAPFSRDFFVPWEAIHATRTRSLLFWETVELQFGDSAIGSLALPKRTAEQLVNAGARFVISSS